MIKGYNDVPWSQAEPVWKETLVEGHEALWAPRLQEKTNMVKTHFIFLSSDERSQVFSGPFLTAIRKLVPLRFDLDT